LCRRLNGLGDEWDYYKILSKLSKFHRFKSEVITFVPSADSLVLFFVIIFFVPMSFDSWYRGVTFFDISLCIGYNKACD